MDDDIQDQETLLNESSASTDHASAKEPAPDEAPSQDASGDAETSRVDEAGNASKPARKRTKTGCLTCRKRRIKCGEERPNCNNCIKSRRKCEGYNPRVIFKDPLHGLQLASLDGPTDPSMSIDHFSRHSSLLASQNPLIAANLRPGPLPIAPRPPAPPAPPMVGPLVSPNTATTHLRYGDASLMTPTVAPIDPSWPAGVDLATGEDGSHTQGSHPVLSAASFGISTSQQQPPGPHLAHVRSNILLSQRGIADDSPTLTQPASDPPGLEAHNGLRAHSLSSMGMPWPVNDGRVAKRLPDDADPDAVMVDDDLVFSDSESNAHDSTSAAFGSNVFGQAGSAAGLTVSRSFRQGLNQPRLLATYHPSPTTLALKDPKAARIFRHFVTVTAPSLSIFERHPGNPSLALGPSNLPASRRSLWTYSMPTLALGHPPLLHAILALASLHIAKLQGDTMVPSLKHYHIALRRVARYVSLPRKRSEVGTLAATLLLGFWEVMAAEHVKWNSHLLGARQLLLESNFAGRARRAQAHFRRRKSWQVSLDTTADDGSSAPVVDDDLLHLIRGTSPTSDEASLPAMDETIPMSVGEIEEHELRSDLYWWYLKQDLFQSILSGNHLLLPYDRWSQCPPRAAFGDVDAAYGTFDHLILFLGRIADFTARDQSRKKRLVEANGGQWRPPASAGAPAAGPSGPNAAAGPGAAMPPSASTQQGPPPAPMMYGMVPPREPAQLPRAFAADGSQSPASSASSHVELDVATKDAEHEWAQIFRVLQTLKNGLGPSFQPLSPELMQPLSTPFGPAAYYRTSTVACIWMVIHMCHIILQRVHPDMPPFAMMAAGVAAAKTAQAANEICRIASGLLPTGPGARISPSLGGALIESTVPYFFAGVQLREPAQRGWAASKLQDIARLTGWETSLAIASGCEAAWERAAQAGRGPPYVRTVHVPGQVVAQDGRRVVDTSHIPDDENDRRFIAVSRGTRIHWACGVLGLETDLESLGIDEN